MPLTPLCPSCCAPHAQAVVNLYSFVGFLVLSVTYPLLVTRRIRRGILYDRPQVDGGLDMV